MTRTTIRLGTADDTMTDDLLDAGRVMMGKISLERHPLDLAEVVREQLATLASTGRLSSHELRVDLRPAIREQWVLNVPAFAECRPDCKGICPTCGADLNAGPCSCGPATDSRWEALRASRTRAD